MSSALPSPQHTNSPSPTCTFCRHWGYLELHSGVSISWRCLHGRMVLLGMIVLLSQRTLWSQVSVVSMLFRCGSFFPSNLNHVCILVHWHQESGLSLQQWHSSVSDTGIMKIEVRYLRRLFCTSEVLSHGCSSKRHCLTECPSVVSISALRLCLILPGTHASKRQNQLPRLQVSPRCLFSSKWNNEVCRSPCQS